MAWEETRRIHRFDDLSFVQEDKLLEQAVPAKTRVATDIQDGKPPAKKPCTGDVSGVLETPLLSPTAAPEFKRSSTMGGISLSGNAVIHQLTNFTRTE